VRSHLRVINAVRNIPIVQIVKPPEALWLEHFEQLEPVLD
jgi:hypothetical protein